MFKLVFFNIVFAYNKYTDLYKTEAAALTVTEQIQQGNEGDDKATPLCSQPAPSNYDITIQGGGSHEYASQEPWRPEDWDGNEDALWNLVHAGRTISHDLKCLLQLLISFLENTVGNITAKEDRWLWSGDLTDSERVTLFMLKYDIPCSPSAVASRNSSAG
ncbi:hypothetical protein PC128_g23371 [Phytophthora cactorum]|nr:hypothetical protein PC128_g23371 [Phytophthora cactorum]